LAVAGVGKKTGVWGTKCEREVRYKVIGTFAHGKGIPVGWIKQE